MKNALAIAMLCGMAGLVTPIRAQDQGADKKPPTEDLVKAAKDAKAKRQKSATKVITNKDVKNSTGKLIVLDTPAAPAEKAPTDTTGPLQKQDEKLRKHQEAVDRVVLAQKKVDGLQKALDAVEQQYYETNDPNYRDKVIQDRFAQTKHQLEDAKHQLSDARDALQKLEPPPK